MADLFPCHYLSQELTEDVAFDTLTFQKNEQQVHLQVPLLTPQQLGNELKRITEQRNRYIAKLRTDEIVEMIDEAVQHWLEPRYELRQLAEEMLPVITGYDREMVRLFLSRYLRHYRRESLQRIIDEDFPNPLVLDQFRPRKAGGIYRAYGPQLVTHIFSGNVPALPLWSMVSGLLLKSATLGKVSSAEPLFPVLFATTLAEVEPRLAKSMAITWWQGGDEGLERVAFDHSEAVVAYGNEQTINAISKKIPSSVRLVEHGHKLSFGVITQECLSPAKVWEVAHLAAHDVSWFDQQGCLSPHVLYVERGASITPRDFAHFLAQEMANFEHKMPRAPLSAEENQAIVQLRSQAEFQSYTDTGIEVMASESGTTWTVLYRDDESSDFPLSVLNRVVTVVPIDNLEDIIRKTATIKHVLQTVGVACPPQKFRHLVDILGECGVNRICSIGEMPQPQPGWHHDGRFNLADLVRWCDVEASVEERMEEFDPNRK